MSVKLPGDSSYPPGVSQRDVESSAEKWPRDVTVQVRATFTICDAQSNENAVERAIDLLTETEHFDIVG